MKNRQFGPKIVDYFEREIPTRATIQFNRTVANLVPDRENGRIQLVFEIDSDATHRKEYHNYGKGKEITLQHMREPGEWDEDARKKKEAAEIVRSIKTSVLGSLQRWGLLRAPVEFLEPEINANKGATVIIFNILVRGPDKFADAYDKLEQAIRLSKHFGDMSTADPHVDQSQTEADWARAANRVRTDAANRTRAAYEASEAERTDFTLDPEVERACSLSDQGNKSDEKTIIIEAHHTFKPMNEYEVERD